MSNSTLMDCYTIMFVMNIILIIALAFSLHFSLYVTETRNKNKELEKVNDKYNNAIIKQHKEIENLKAIVEEYRTVLKGM